MKGHGITQTEANEPDLASRLAEITGLRVVATAQLAGGCVAEVSKVVFENGDCAVVKSSSGKNPSNGGLAVEGWMLEFLARNSSLPVPSVRHCDHRLLVMDYIPSGERLTESAELHAADLLAELHAITAENFGLERETVIGGLPQLNPYAGEWVPFFRDYRLMFMARAALNEGVLPLDMVRRIEALASRLDSWLAEPDAPSLIHGDMWGGNILVCQNRIAGFIDPALYFADREIELAFSMLFSTFGDPFFQRYGEQYPLSKNFFTERRYIYNLYPLLVHVRLFGRNYLAQIDNILKKFGF